MRRLNRSSETGRSIRGAFDLLRSSAGARRAAAADQPGKTPVDLLLDTSQALGSITVSMTWMQPFDCLTSAIVTVATSPFSSVSVILSPLIFAVSMHPPTVLTG